jgi:hypothetical protein
LNLFGQEQDATWVQCGVATAEEANGRIAGYENMSFSQKRAAQWALSGRGSGENR